LLNRLRPLALRLLTGKPNVTGNGKQFGFRSNALL
jgi:hypothetical protein